jgi:hypothetical protein
MALQVWPRVTPAELQLKEAETQERELRWIVDETVAVCQDLKHGLDDCYALLAPIDPGSTLVMSTPRAEKVKGTITRVGTRIVKGTLNIQLRTVPAQALTLSQTDPIHIHALDSLHSHLTQSIDLLGLVTTRPQDAPSLASTLGLLSDTLARSAALLKGPSLAEPFTSWQTGSAAASHFSPPLPPNLSFHLGLQDSCVVLHLRALEPADVPVHFGMKLGLAIGTVRRLEHDEMDKVFSYSPGADDVAHNHPGSARHTPDPHSKSRAAEERASDVYVREKVRVESADPSLISLYSKLGYLSNQLAQARRNLAAVLGTGLEDS